MANKLKMEKLLKRVQLLKVRIQIFLIKMEMQYSSRGLTTGGQ